MNQLKFRHVDLRQRNFKSWKVFDFLKNHLTLVLLLPTLTGGIVQILQLANLGLPFIKYFSYAQVIPDGLTYLIAFVVLIIVLMYVFGLSKVMLGRISINSSKIKIIAHNAIVIFLINIFLLSYLNISNESTIGLVFFKLFLALSGVVFFFYLIFLFIYFFAYFYIYFNKVDFLIIIALKTIFLIKFIKIIKF